MRSVVVAFLLACAAMPAHAASGKDWNDCESDDPKIAFAGCSRVIAAGPDLLETSQAYYNRAILQDSFRHDADAALADYTRAIEIQPKHDFALHNRGMIYDARGNYRAALGDFSASIALNPIPGHFLNRGRVNFHAGHFRAAADDFTTAIQLWPDEPTLRAAMLAYRARALAASGNDLVDARADADEAVHLAPANPDVWIARAVVRFRQGDFAGAMADAAKALTLVPVPPGGPLLDTGKADALFLKGLAALRLGDKTSGERDLAAAAVLDPALAARYAKAEIAR